MTIMRRRITFSFQRKHLLITVAFTVYRALYELNGFINANTVHNTFERERRVQYYEGKEDDMQSSSRSQFTIVTDHF